MISNNQLYISCKLQCKISGMTDRNYHEGMNMPSRSDLVILVFYIEENRSLVEATAEFKSLQLWLSGLGALFRTREVPGSSPVNSRSCEDNISQCFLKVYRVS